MRVTSLDAGAARLIQFSLVYTVPIRLEKEDLENGTRHVAAKWPRSNSWIDPLRRHMVRFVLHKGVDILRTREIPVDFRDHVSKFPRAANANFIDIALLNDLFKNWLGLSNLNVFERVLTIKAVQFNDVTVIRFKVQHPLTDIGGLLQIVATFCEGLGNPNKEADMKEIEQTQKRLYKAETGKEIPDDKTPIAEEVLVPPKDADVLHESYWNRGWFSLIGTGLRVWGSISKQRARSESMAFIPQPVLDKWRTTSKDNGTYITENDLVMAWIHKCLLKYIKDNKLETSPEREHFAFIMNIEKFLSDEKTGLGNPWIVVPVPEKAGGDDPILAHAAEMRQAVSKARRKEVINSILEQHKGLNNIPYLPRHHGWTGAPHLVVTSWIHQPLYDFNFATPKQPEKASPNFVQGCQHIYKLLQQLQIPLPGLVSTWKGKNGGIWMAGDLEVGLWREILKLPGV